MKKGLKVLIGGIVVVGVICAVGGNGEDKEVKTVKENNEVVQEEQTFIDVTMNDLIADLENNPAMAKQKYKDMYINVTGIVDNIDSDGKYFSIKNDEDFILTGLQISLDKDQQEGLANISMNQEITVKVKITDVGEVLGYSGDLVAW